MDPIWHGFISALTVLILAVAGWIRSHYLRKKIEENTQLTRAGNAHAAEAANTAAEAVVIAKATSADLKSGQKEMAEALNGRLSELVDAQKTIGHQEGVDEAQGRQSPKQTLPKPPLPPEAHRD